MIHICKENTTSDIAIINKKNNKIKNCTLPGSLDFADDILQDNVMAENFDDLILCPGANVGDIPQSWGLEVIS